MVRGYCFSNVQDKEKSFFIVHNCGFAWLFRLIMIIMTARGREASRTFPSAKILRPVVESMLLRELRDAYSQSWTKVLCEYSVMLPRSISCSCPIRAACSPGPRHCSRLFTTQFHLQAAAVSGVIIMVNFHGFSEIT